MRSSSNCDDSTWNYYPPDKLCYKKFPEDLKNDLKNQWDAQADCEAKGGCLLTLDSLGKQGFIDGIISRVYHYPACNTAKNIQYCMWTSGNSTQPFGPWPPVNSWQWNCPDVIVPTPISDTGITNWGPLEPNNGKNEVAIMINQPKIGVWNNYMPSGEMSYICQKPSKK